MLNLNFSEKDLGLLFLPHFVYDFSRKMFKSAVKYKTGTTLRINLKLFNGNDLPHELLLTTRQKKKQNQEMLLRKICQLI